MALASYLQPPFPQIPYITGQCCYWSRSILCVYSYYYNVHETLLYIIEVIFEWLEKN